MCARNRCATVVGLVGHRVVSGREPHEVRRRRDRVQPLGPGPLGLQVEVAVRLEAEVEQARDHRIAPAAPRAAEPHARARFRVRQRAAAGRADEPGFGNRFDRVHHS